MTTQYLAHYGVKGQKHGVRRWQYKNGSLTPEGYIHYGYGKRTDSAKRETPKNTKLLKNYSGPCFFISEIDAEQTTIKPRVPINYLTKNGYEDSETPRVCFSSDVGKCLTALSQNVTGKTYTVYEPDDVRKYSVYKPNTIAVPDSSITDEMWITSPVTLKKVGTIKCTGDDGKDGMTYTYGDNHAELYGWNYSWISKDLKHSDLCLAHYGVPRQRWGVRRYQNYDGTYTELGKQRLRGELGKAAKARAKLISEHRKVAELSENGKEIMERLRHTEDFSRLSEHMPSLNLNYKELSSYREEARTYKREGMTCVDYFDGKTRVAQFDIDDTKTIWGVHVNPEYRGQGLGSQLIRQAVDKYGGGSLYVFLDNEIAIKMYSDAGFTFDDSGYVISEWTGEPEGKMAIKR